MNRADAKMILIPVLAAAGIWLGLKYLLPCIMPFLLGGALALAAEPLVKTLRDRLRVPRAAASGIGVAMAFSLVVLVLLMVGAVLFREFGRLCAVLPDMSRAFRSGMQTAQDWLLALIDRMPEDLRSWLTQSVLSLFSGGNQIVSQSVSRLLSAASSVLAVVPESVLTIGTAILSAFMISVKLSTIRSWLGSRIPDSRKNALLGAIRSARDAVVGWLRAQLKLMALSFAIVGAGLVLLRIPNFLLWAAVIALVDAIPVLGTGTVLVPWAAVSFLQHDTVMGIGLLGVYAAATATRSAMEPKLVGAQLGLDPLLTLACIYAGYRFWGFPGMLLTPILAVAAVKTVGDLSPGNP